jgi:hypothetical protein
VFELVVFFSVKVYWLSLLIFEHAFAVGHYFGSGPIFSVLGFFFLLLKAWRGLLVYLGFLDFLF